MFKKKQKTFINIEVTDGNFVVKVGLSPNDDPKTLLLMINALLDNHPSMYAGITGSISVWSKRENWVEQGQYIINSMAAFQKNRLPTPIIDHGPLIKPSRVINHIKNNVNEGKS